MSNELSIEDYAKLGITPKGEIVWPNISEMMQYNFAYHKFSIGYEPLEFRPLEFFDGCVATLHINAAVEVDVTLSYENRRVLMIIVLEHTDIRWVTFHTAATPA